MIENISLYQLLRKKQSKSTMSFDDLLRMIQWHPSYTIREFCEKHKRLIEELHTLNGIPLPEDGILEEHTPIRRDVRFVMKDLYDRHIREEIDEENYYCESERSCAQLVEKALSFIGACVFLLGLCFIIYHVITFILNIS